MHHLSVVIWSKFPTRYPGFASQRSFLRKTNNYIWQGNEQTLWSLPISWDNGYCLRMWGSSYMEPKVPYLTILGMASQQFGHRFSTTKWRLRGRTLDRDTYEEKNNCKPNLLSIVSNSPNIFEKLLSDAVLRLLNWKKDNPQDDLWEHNTPCHSLVHSIHGHSYRWKILYQISFWTFSVKWFPLTHSVNNIQ